MKAALKSPLERAREMRMTRVLQAAASLRNYTIGMLKELERTPDNGPKYLANWVIQLRAQVGVIEERLDLLAKDEEPG